MSAARLTVALYLLNEIQNELVERTSVANWPYAATSCSLSSQISQLLPRSGGELGRCRANVPPPGNYGHRIANRYQYTVVELRERMIGGKMSGDKLENVLNEHAAQGWQLKAITSVEVKGRVGPGGVEGLLVTFERPVGRA
jgi:hypothetical protein